MTKRGYTRCNRAFDHVAKLHKQIGAFYEKTHGKQSVSAAGPNWMPAQAVGDEISWATYFTQRAGSEAYAGHCETAMKAVGQARRSLSKAHKAFAAQKRRGEWRHS
jgi:hypothetical protein